MKSNIFSLFPTCRRGCAHGRMDSWIGTWWSIDSEAWLQKWDCGVDVLLCYKIQTLLELSNTHCIQTQTLTRTSFWGGQIWIWRMGTIGDNLQKFKKFLKNCHKMFRGMVEPDKSLISTLAFLSSCSCQFRHPANFVAFENLDNLYSFCSLLKFLKLLAILKMLKN